jgi:xanthosine utilization system XapX-like protein
MINWVLEKKTKLLLVIFEVYIVSSIAAPKISLLALSGILTGFKVLDWMFEKIGISDVHKTQWEKE